MGNTIFIHHDSPMDEWLSMNNELTSLFISLIGLSGSRLAKREDEKHLIIWILEKDQSACGIGNVGFELIHMPWKKKDFLRQQAFIQKVLDGIDQQLGWETLNNKPDPKLIKYTTNRFRRMIKKLTEEDIDEMEGIKWLQDATEEDPIHQGFPKCPKHGVYQTIFGCYVCNNER